MSVDISYYAFNQKRADEGWQKFLALDLKQVKPGKEHGTDLQLQDSNLLYGLHQGAMYEDEFKQYVIELDILLGSVIAHIYEGRIQDILMQALFEIVLPDLDLGYKATGYNIDTSALSPEKIIKLFENLSYQKIEDAWIDRREEMAAALGVNEEYLDDYYPALVEFAQQVQPIAKDLKESGSMFVVQINGDFPDDVIPLLNERFEKHKQELLERFPWIKQTIM